MLMAISSESLHADNIEKAMFREAPEIEMLLF
jgi:hypothetical protein